MLVWRALVNSKPEASAWCAACRWNVREMRTLFYIFAICFAGLFLFVTVNRFERNRPLATLLMILLVGITAAAVLKQLMP
jgi:hypothetical protein